MTQDFDIFNNEDRKQVHITHFCCSTNQAPEYYTNKNRRDFKRMKALITTIELSTFSDIQRILANNKISLRISPPSERLSANDRQYEGL